jgi:hypothetical protein
MNRVNKHASRHSRRKGATSTSTIVHVIPQIVPHAPCTSCPRLYIYISLSIVDLFNDGSYVNIATHLATSVEFVPSVAPPSTRHDLHPLRPRPPPQCLRPSGVGAVSPHRHQPDSIHRFYDTPASPVALATSSLVLVHPAVPVRPPASCRLVLVPPKQDFKSLKILSIVLVLLATSSNAPLQLVDTSLAPAGSIPTESVSTALFLAPRHKLRHRPPPRTTSTSVLLGRPLKPRLVPA